MVVTLNANMMADDSSTYSKLYGDEERPGGAQPPAAGAQDTRPTHKLADDPRLELVLWSCLLRSAPRTPLWHSKASYFSPPPGPTRTRSNTIQATATSGGDACSQYVPTGRNRYIGKSRPQHGPRTQITTWTTAQTTTRATYTNRNTHDNAGHHTGQQRLGDSFQSHTPPTAPY